jgi:DNA-binding transcriptional ArsR family regulator
MENTVTLDKASFKALAVETRVDILKVLQSRQHTQTELADALELSVPTVKEHLDALVSAGLVERKDEGRKWVYYALTKKGKAILNPEETKFWIVLGTLALTVGGAVTGYLRGLFAPMYNPAAQPLMASAKEAVIASANEAAVESANAVADAAASGAQAVADAAPRMMAAPMPTAAPLADQGAQALDALQATNLSPPAGAGPETGQLPWGWIVLGVIVLAQLCLLGYFWHKSRQQKKQWDTLGIKQQ